MLASIRSPRPRQKYTEESTRCLPEVVQRLLAEQPALQLNPDVGLLIGTNTEEGNLYLVPQGHLDSSMRADVERM